VKIIWRRGQVKGGPGGPWTRAPAVIEQ